MLGADLPSSLPLGGVRQFWLQHFTGERPAGPQILGLV
jgi:hypothetical protein